MIVEMGALIALILISASMVLALYRLVIGPDVADRILALDTLVVNSIALIMTVSITLSTTLYFEGALLFAMVGFLSTVAFCKYLMRGDVIE